MTHQFDFIVHSFEGSIGDPEFGPSQEPGEMIFDQSCKLDDGLESRVSGPPEPLFEVGLGSFFLKVIPKPLEFLLEVVSPDDGKVEFKQIRESSMFFGGKVPGILQQNEASLFEIDPLLMSQPSDFRSSSFVNGPIQVLYDMKAIKDQGGLRGMLLNRSQIGSPHIQTDGLKSSGSTFSQPSEELIDGLLFPVQPHPQKFSSFQIIDQGEIAMSLLSGDLIDAEDMQGFDLPQLQPFLHDPFDHGGDHFPIQSKVFSDFLEGQFLRQQSNGLSQCLGDPFPSSCPRDFLHSQPTSRTKDSKGTIDDPEGFVSEREISPTPLRTSPPGRLRFPSASEFDFKLEGYFPYFC